MPPKPETLRLGREAGDLKCQFQRPSKKVVRKRIGLFGMWGLELGLSKSGFRFLSLLGLTVGRVRVGLGFWGFDLG